MLLDDRWGHVLKMATEPFVFKQRRTAVLAKRPQSMLIVGVASFLHNNRRYAVLEHGTTLPKGQITSPVLNALPQQASASLPRRRPLPRARPRLYSSALL